MLHAMRIRLGRRWITILLAPVVLFIMIRWFEHSQIYIPMARLSATGDVLARPWDDVYFEAADGVRLNGWHFPGPAGSERSRMAVLICHGNAGNISHRLDLYELLHGLGLSVFAFDYRGYGNSEGRPSEEGTYLDARAAHEWLCAKGYGATNILVLGESLGGAIATELALTVPVGGIILQSTFTSIPDIGAELFPWLPVKLLATIRYDTVSKLPRIRVPVLVMHSRDDGIVGFRHAERNFAVANEPKMLWEIDGDHNDSLLDGGQRYQKGFEQFLSMLMDSETTAK